VRADAPEGGQGKPCGASHIPKAHKCSKKTGLLTAANLKTAAKAALAVGAVAGGAYLAKRGMMSMEEWRNSPESARNKPKPVRVQRPTPRRAGPVSSWKD